MAIGPAACWAQTPAELPPPLHEPNITDYKRRRWQYDPATLRKVYIFQPLSPPRNAWAAMRVPHSPWRAAVGVGLPASSPSSCWEDWHGWRTGLVLFRGHARHLSARTRLGTSGPQPSASLRRTQAGLISTQLERGTDHTPPALIYANVMFKSAHRHGGRSPWNSMTAPMAQQTSNGPWLGLQPPPTLSNFLVFMPNTQQIMDGSTRH